MNIERMPKEKAIARMEGTGKKGSPLKDRKKLNRV
jgi:hypothetical protein